MTQADPLARYAARRDAEAFAEIVTQYQRVVFGACRRRLHNPDDVEDAVQETFLRLARKASRLHTNLGGWLHACALNVSTDFNRRRQSRLRHESAARQGDSMDDTQGTLAELREHLDAAMEKLPAADRELIIQRIFAGRTQLEIAAEMGAAPSTISQRLDRAVESLRKHLKAMGCGAAAVTGLTGLLEAEHASAAIPATVTANLIKIGLGGAPSVSTGGIAGITAAIAALILSTGLAIAAAIWVLTGSNRSSPMASNIPPATRPAPVAVTVAGNQEIRATTTEPFPPSAAGSRRPEDFAGKWAGK